MREHLISACSGGRLLAFLEVGPLRQQRDRMGEQPRDVVDEDAAGAAGKVARVSLLEGRRGAQKGREGAVWAYPGAGVGCWPRRPGC